MALSIPRNLSRTSTSTSTSTRASTPSAQDCAEAVLEVMPAVMDAMRGAMRLQVGEQLSVPQFRCLNYIAGRPGSSVSAVAAFLGVTLPTASVMVDRLVRAGAVAPGTAQADRRRSELRVTAAGLAQVQHIEIGALGEFARTLGACSAGDLQALHAGLLVLRRAFQPAHPTTHPAA
jgi:DNA-binding MarR family transcriptional regulator